MPELAHLLKFAQEEIIRLQQEAAQFTRDEAMFKAAAASQEFVNSQLRGKGEEIRLQATRNWNRPSILLGAEVVREERTKGGVWVASARGASAEGNSPEMAFLAFDELWTQGES